MAMAQSQPLSGHGFVERWPMPGKIVLVARVIETDSDP